MDGNTIAEISGYYDFSTFNHILNKGSHDLVWRYRKISDNNVGQDIGRVRNINILNTTSGEWYNTMTDVKSIQLENLYPDQSYIYRAYTSNSKQEYTYSKIYSFRTKAITPGIVSLSSVTQTTAALSFAPDYGDANIKLAYHLLSDVSYGEDSSFFKYLLDSSTYGDEIYNLTDLSQIEIHQEDDWRCVGAYGHTISVSFDLEEAGNVSFEMFSQLYGSSCVATFTIDGKTYNVNSVWDTDPKNFKKYSYSLEAGSHTLSWYGGIKHVSSYRTDYGHLYLRNLFIKGLKKNFIKEGEVFCDSSPLIINEMNLLPGFNYYVQSQLLPAFISDLPYAWNAVSTDDFAFSTLPISVIAEVTNEIKPTTANVIGEIEKGDAIIESAGLQYKAKNGSRWSHKLLDPNKIYINEAITRLKPNTDYECRIFAVPSMCDTVFSSIISFKTKQAIGIDSISDIYQLSANIRGYIYDKENIKHARLIVTSLKNDTIIDKRFESADFVEEQWLYGIDNLQPSTTYNVTFIAENEDGEILSSEIQFTTSSFFNSTTPLVDNVSQTHANVSVPVNPTNIKGVNYGFKLIPNYNGTEQFYESQISDSLSYAYLDRLNSETKYRIIPYAECEGRFYYGTTDTTFCTPSFFKNDLSIGDMRYNYITAHVNVSLAETDEIITAYGFIVTLYKTIEDQYKFVYITPEENKLQAKLIDLAPGKDYYVCPFVIVNGKTYMGAFKNFSTRKYFVSTSIATTQTTAIISVRNTIYSDDETAKIEHLSCEIDGKTFILEDRGKEYSYLELNGIWGSYQVSKFTGSINGQFFTWETNGNNKPFEFSTKPISVKVTVDQGQTFLDANWIVEYGDATYLGSKAIVTHKQTGTILLDTEQSGNTRIFVKELEPNTDYILKICVNSEESGLITPSITNLHTESILCTTNMTENVSNRSATLNGEIVCDTESSAEFGFQWKQMEGWQSSPAFTKGVKREDGIISVALVNGMLEPNTDYQYRTAVRYHDGIYASNDWKTFRTESEFIYYPATVYTVFRTDRENNALIMCGYYIAGSEAITSQGYEYWQVGHSSSRASAPQNVVTITTDESMQHTFLNGELANGNYAVRAFVKTETGDVLYGATLGFTVSDIGFSGVDTIVTDNVRVFAENSILKLFNANGLSCYIFDLRGLLIAERNNLSEYEEFHLNENSIYIIKLSNGKVLKIRI